jgi:hypothetical protein
LPCADETEDLAAHHVEIEPLHDDLLGKGDLEIAHADDRLGLAVSGDIC